jgi:toxin-antitoxin system PIN domain toxin
MRALLDISMLLALFDTKHLHNRAAQAWWRDNRDHGWATCPLTENGFLRIVSQRGYSNPVAMADALAMLRGWAKPPLHAFWPDDVSLLDAAVIDHGRVLGPRQLTDIYLLALATRHGGRFVTLDRGISVRAVHGAEPANLVMVL